VASSKLNQFLKNENLTVEKREEVDLIVHITELGINVINRNVQRINVQKCMMMQRTGDRMWLY
jgi:hypothetical protein